MGKTSWTAIIIRVCHPTSSVKGMGRFQASALPPNINVTELKTAFSGMTKNNVLLQSVLQLNSNALPMGNVFKWNGYVIFYLFRFFIVFPRSIQVLFFHRPTGFLMDSSVVPPRSQRKLCGCSTA
jgi:hypothetical protein